MTPMISIHQIGKQYRLGEVQPYYTFRDTFSNLLRPRKHDRQNTFWALDDITFNVAPGEVVGLIGRNGAGKSTLLKILSQITPPTRGKIQLHGRVASLLEVGTGFHPELTGRENIFLNGAILGMAQREIRAKFDEIVAFADIEAFLDTPVKRYSSGMYVRLAFAVAAHLEPEILLVDEVLAVGDAAFQRKCLGKMDEVARTGRTILFVSHNMAAIRRLCHRSVLLENGRLTADGETDNVITTYLSHISDGASATELTSRPDRTGDGRAQFTHVRLLLDGQPSEALVTGKPAALLLDYKVSDAEKLRDINVSLGIDNQVGERICALSTELVGQHFPSLPTKGTIRVDIPNLPLLPGRYAVTLFLTAGGVVADWITQAAFFTVEGGDYFGTGRLPEGQGSILIDHKFHIS